MARHPKAPRPPRRAALGMIAALAGSAALAVPGLAPEPAHAAGPSLAPHKAVYALSLASTEPGGVVGARGKMTYKLEGTCSGWAMETRTKLDISYAEGGQLDTLWEYVAYEARDGGDFSFFVRNTHNGEIDEVLEGEARRPEGGGPLTARFSRPDDASVTLAPRTLFPNAHTLDMLQAAARGETYVVREVFDGATKEGASLVTVFVGRGLDASAPGEVESPLLDTPSWRMTIAFFGPEGDDEPGQEGTPNYEVSVRYHDNGVAQEMVQDFGFFTLTTRLIDLEPLPDPEC